MSFGSFFHRIAAIFSRSGLGNVTNDLHAASIAIAVVEPGLVLALQEAGAAEPSNEISQVSQEVQSDLGMLQTLLTEAAAGDTSKTAEILSLLQAIKQNTAGLLKAGHIKNPTTAARVSAAVDAFVNEASIIIGLLEPQAAPAA